MKRETIQFRKVLLLLAMLLVSFDLLAQIAVTGTVTDEGGMGLPGVTVLEKGTTNGIITDLDGKFRLSVSSNSAVLTFSFVGYDTQELSTASTKNLSVVLKETAQEIEEVVVVGYGQQKKASVVGAITQTSGKVLERSGGVSNVGAALTGNLPGVVTAQNSGQPGEEDPKIQIRGASSWNGSEPLVLVDGIKRSMSSVDISSVASISVLKDASATAVYGVEGANGVILITTKRGQEGSAKIDAGYSTTIKQVSKLPGKMDSYDALMARNTVLERELPLNSGAWNYVRSQEFINNYRNQDDVTIDPVSGYLMKERYANIDWQDYLFKNAAVSHQAYVNVSGGTKFVRYFAAVDYVHESDVYKTFNTGMSYDPEFSYNRINVRSNLDFNLTKSTVFKVNLAGSNGIKNSPRGAAQGDAWQSAAAFRSAYETPPDVFYPIYSDGSIGIYPDDKNLSNSVRTYGYLGAFQTNNTSINTDFILEQQLNMITKGLSFRATLSMDNGFQEINRGQEDIYSNKTPDTYIDPVTGAVAHPNGGQRHELLNTRPYAVEAWTTSSGSINNGATSRRLYYQAQLNYNREFGKHNVGGMGLFSRNQYAVGSMIPTYREDWAFRATYNWAGKYFAEYSGAYNGSEKFSKDNRFAFFNSGAFGWLITGEDFMSELVNKHIVEILKLRASIGQIGDDNVGDRWMYLTQWAQGGSSNMGTTSTGSGSAYKAYYQSLIGNEDIHWETVTKKDIGLDFSFFGGLVAGSFDIFSDRRTDIILDGYSRAIPDYYGAKASTVNYGEVKNRGYELEVRMEKNLLGNKMRLWGNFNMTHNENEIIDKDDPEFAPAYQKSAGYQIGQTRTYIDAGFINDYDELYASPAHNTLDESRMPGDYYIIDFNADGVVDTEDAAPYAHPTMPQNTYNATIGIDYKGFSFFAQFYGVSNVSRYIGLSSFGGMKDNAYEFGTWWTADGTDADMNAPRFITNRSSYSDGTQYTFDGSYIRLKNVEIAYSWNNGWIKKLGMSYFKIYANGNNLWLWTRTPDDREINDSGQQAYPTVRRFNFGVKFSF